MTARSMNAPGSPSSPLQMMYFLPAGWIRAISHLRPVGKPPPPRPRRPESRMVLQTASGSMALKALAAAW